MSTHNLYFEQKCEKYQFLSENFQFLEVKFSSIFIHIHYSHTYYCNMTTLLYACETWTVYQ